LFVVVGEVAAGDAADAEAAARLALSIAEDARARGELDLR